MLSLRPLQASKMGPFEKINGRFTCYLSSQEVTCYLFSGFRNSSLISSQMIIHLSLLLSFSKSRLWQGKIMYFYLLHTYWCFLHHLRTKSMARAMMARCKCIECVLGRKFPWKAVCQNVKKFIVSATLSGVKTLTTLHFTGFVLRTRSLIFLI